MLHAIVLPGTSYLYWCRTKIMLHAIVLCRFNWYLLSVRFPEPAHEWLLCCVGKQVSREVMTCMHWLCYVLTCCVLCIVYCVLCIDFVMYWLVWLCYVGKQVSLEIISCICYKGLWHHKSLWHHDSLCHKRLWHTCTTARIIFSSLLQL
jgi:hypothetical protein